MYDLAEKLMVKNKVITWLIIYVKKCLVCEIAVVIECDTCSVIIPVCRISDLVNYK